LADRLISPTVAFNTSVEGLPQNVVQPAPLRLQGLTEQ
jgi:hypothetical protein